MFFHVRVVLLVYDAASGAGIIYSETVRTGTQTRCAPCAVLGSDVRAFRLCAHAVRLSEIANAEKPYKLVVKGKRKFIMESRNTEYEVSAPEAQVQSALTLGQIRERIDRVDGNMRKLFCERMGLSKQVACIKAQTDDTIYKPDRETAILEKQSEGMDPQLVMEYRAMLRRMMEISRKYQYGLTLQMRNCFPFVFSCESPETARLAMLREELYICSFRSRDQVMTARTYNQIADWIESGKADAGAGIIEKIGSGVSDELNALLMRRGLYICECRVIEQDTGLPVSGESAAAREKYKVVTFTKTFTVLPDHNRLKLVFIAANRSGALGSILSMIADYGVNVTEIHSIPYRTGEDWNYRFFVELDANLLEEEIKALVFQLSQETMELELLGSYRCEGDFVQ